ncbi:hypothetical protein [Enemella sp. A6]|uniref:hypothetical protein n=1 Tax=Enemella sp. A6 TaxID=3440152 RepID=UPI003EBCC336
MTAEKVLGEIATTRGVTAAIVTTVASTAVVAEPVRKSAAVGGTEPSAPMGETPAGVVTGRPVVVPGATEHADPRDDGTPGGVRIGRVRTDRVATTEAATSEAATIEVGMTGGATIVAARIGVAAVATTTEPHAGSPTGTAAMTVDRGVGTIRGELVAMGVVPMSVVAMTPVGVVPSVVDLSVADPEFDVARATVASRAVVSRSVASMTVARAPAGTIVAVAVTRGGTTEAESSSDAMTAAVGSTAGMIAATRNGRFRPDWNGTPMSRRYPRSIRNCCRVRCVRNCAGCRRRPPKPWGPIWSLPAS